MVWGAQPPNRFPARVGGRGVKGRGDALGCRGPTAQHVACAPVAQGIERLPPEQKAAGSIPAGGTTPETASHQAVNGSSADRSGSPQRGSDAVVRFAPFPLIAPLTCEIRPSGPNGRSVPDASRGHIPGSHHGRAGPHSGVDEWILTCPVDHLLTALADVASKIVELHTHPHQTGWDVLYRFWTKTLNGTIDWLSKLSAHWLIGKLPFTSMILYNLQNGQVPPHFFIISKFLTPITFCYIPNPNLFLKSFFSSERMRSMW